MYHLAYLTAIYMLAMQNHGGQESRGYWLLCLADKRTRREHSAYDLGRTVEQLHDRKKRTIYKLEFRNAVAYFLKKMKRHRRAMG